MRSVVPGEDWVEGEATARGETEEKGLLRGREEERGRFNLVWERSRERLVILEIRRWWFLLAVADGNDETLETRELEESLWEERKQNLLEAKEEQERERSSAVLSMDNRLQMDNPTLT